MRMNLGSKKFRGASSEVCWTSLNVRDILKRREYTGVMIMNNRLWKGLDNPRTVWIDESEWKVFCKVRKADKLPNQYLLRRLIRCGNCGRSIRHQKHTPAVYYHCCKSSANKETSCPVDDRFYEKDLERVVQNDLLDQIEKRLKQISLSRTGAYERYADGSLSQELYLAERDRLYSTADILAVEKEKLEKELVSLIRSKNQDMTDTVQKAQEVLSASELTNDMLLFFIDRVNVYTGMRVEII